MRALRLTTLSVGLLALSACGGGGSGGGTSGTLASATVTGTAAKGLLLDAIVTFYPVTNGMVGTTAIASVRTDSSTGAFSATVSSSGPVVATLTTDSSTRMLDELSGTAIAAPTGLVLHTAIDGVTNLQPIAITPLTEMAYDLAASLPGGLTVANIDAANSDVSNALLDGTPILYTQPISIAQYATATAAEQQLAKLLLAFAVAANEGSATGTTGAACTGGYSANITCMIGGLGKLITVGSSGSVTLLAPAAYLSGAYQAIDAGLVTVDGGKTPSALGLNNTTAAETAFLTAIKQQVPVPGYDASANPLTNTKNLFANIRTNILDQSTTQTFGYSPLLTALSTDISTNVNPVISTTTSLLTGAYRAGQMIQAATVSYQGSCGYDPAGLGTASNVVLCLLGQAGQPVVLTIMQVNATTYSLTTQPLMPPAQGQTVTYNPITHGLVVNPSHAPLGATFTLSGSSPQSASLSGPYYVDSAGGQVTAALSAAESSNWDATTDTGSISLSGTLSKGAGDVSLVNATIGTDSVITVQNGATALATPPSPTTNPSSPPISITGVLDLAQYTTSAFSYAIKLTIGSPVYDASNTVGIPSSIVVTGSIDQVGSTGDTPLFNGSVSVNTQGAAQFNATQPLSATNSLTVQAQVEGSLALSGGRVLTVSATANASELTPTPAKPDSASVTYSYATPSGTAELNASGQYDATNGLTATVTNNAGVVVSITELIGGTLTGTVMANGTETATISGDFIYYSDGTSESLF